jgi:hypothetical protein
MVSSLWLGHTPSHIPCCIAHVIDVLLESFLPRFRLKRGQWNRTLLLGFLFYCPNFFYISLIFTLLTSALFLEIRAIVGDLI